MSSYKTQGLVLKRQNFKENDRLFVIYTKNFGKMRVMARGTRKIQSKLAGHLEPLSFVDLMIARGKMMGNNRNMDQIAGASLINSFPYFQKDLKKYSLSCYYLELMDQLVKNELKDQRLFELLFKVLNYLNNPQKIKKKELILFKNFFVLKLLALLGYAPELYQCVVCYKKIKPFNNSFDIFKGGLVCPNCQKENSCFFSQNAIKMFRLLLAKKLEEVLKIRIDCATLKELDKAVDSFLKTHLDQELKSDKFLCLLY